MRPRDSDWPRLLLNLSVFLLLGVLVGWLVGSVAGGVIAVLVATLGWSLYQLYRLDRWVMLRGRGPVPQARGQWGETFDRLHRVQVRHRVRRRRLVKRLRRFREATDAMPDAVVIIGPHAEIWWWNRAAERLLGLRAPEDERQRLTAVFRHPDFVAYISRGAPVEPLVVVSPLDETTMLEIRISPYGRSRRLLLARDVTRLQRLEAMRREFVANVSHELRTPLTVVRGFTETFESPEAEDLPAIRQYMPMLDEQARRMQSLVDDLLLLARLETTAPDIGDRPAGVPAMLSRLVDEARAYSGALGHRIRLDCDSGLDVIGSEPELRSVCNNLLTNAVKYTPAGGAIVVTWCRRGDQAEFSVTDSGSGIAARHIPRLTERFYRVDEGRSSGAGGTGLGLAIVKHALDRHGTRLSIESVVGRGSTFSFRLPAVAVERPVTKTP